MTQYHKKHRYSYKYTSTLKVKPYEYPHSTCMLNISITSLNVKTCIFYLGTSCKYSICCLMQ